MEKQQVDQMVASKVALMVAPKDCCRVDRKAEKMVGMKAIQTETTTVVDLARLSAE